MQVVLDTNIFLSALMTPTGTARRIVDAWLNRRFVLLSHARQLDELRVTTRFEKVRTRVRRADAGTLMNQITTLADMPSRLPSIRRSPDPRDDFLLALSEAGNADRLVTGDKRDLLALSRHAGTTIVTAAAFAAELRLYPAAR